jgi:protein Tex
VETLKDLYPGMILEGVVTNVANFGAFVDIGVHQDGLVHISALAEIFVKDPRDVVRVGQTVSVKVLEVDVARKRVALTMRLNDTAEPARHAAPISLPAVLRQRLAASGVAEVWAIALWPTPSPS